VNNKFDCDNCGKIHLTNDQMMLQMANPDSVWKCPTCIHQIWPDDSDDITYETISARDLHDSDILVLNTGADQSIWELKKDASGVTVSFEHHTWTIAPDYQVKVATDRECYKCSGRGIFHGAGRVENGKFIGFTGPCFPCAGTGLQNRKDRIRTSTYWSKYARIGQ
jgi:hypothetical protein